MKNCVWFGYLFVFKIFNATLHFDAKLQKIRFNTAGERVSFSHQGLNDLDAGRLSDALKVNINNKTPKMIFCYIFFEKYIHKVAFFCKNPLSLPSSFLIITLLLAFLLVVGWLVVFF